VKGLGLDDQGRAFPTGSGLVGQEKAREVLKKITITITLL
jgi:DNA helicase TIP49 (TBP-interacting protein)